MLHRLSIRNYAIIDRLEINFNERLNIITGETGAGKSIVLGALGLILGERADTKVLYDAGEKCVVEADFEVRASLKSFFAQHELDFDHHTIIRREILQSGKSRAFVNDTPVTLNVLSSLGEQLVNLHNQHETLELVKSGFQLNVIDALAKNKESLSNYRTQFSAYRKDYKRFEELMERQRNASAELDYLSFQLNELAEAKLVAGEQETLEYEQKTLSNVEEIKRALQAALQLMEGAEQSALEQLREVQIQLRNAGHVNKEIAVLNERIESALLELKDVSSELESLQESTSINPQRLHEVEERLNTLFRLQKKHAVNSSEDLLRIEEELAARVQAVDSGAEEIEVLRGTLDKQLKELQAIASQLHSNRERVLREFQNGVVVLLTKVGMPGASFKVELKQLAQHELNEKGLSEIKFLFSANKGFAAQEIKEVASGGELSRLMLCIKSLLADADDLPTMIFDEIDAGISGEVALKVGEIMKRLSRHHQLISITHLPQIARCADAHFHIFKQTQNAKTVTRIRTLEGNERVIEIAKMMSGEKPSEAAMASARELMGEK